jgi:hypothetical protein
MRINIPDNLWSDLRDRALSQGYDNPENYVLNLLEELVRLSAVETGENDEPADEKVKERLRQLGYLD